VTCLVASRCEWLSVKMLWICCTCCTCVQQ